MKPFIQWVLDKEGDIGLSFFWGIVTFVKYKHSTLVCWRLKGTTPAPKWVQAKGSLL